MIEHQPDSENQRAPNQSRSGIRRGVRILAGLFVLILVYEIANLFLSKPLRIAKETTLITEPLTSDGKQVDFFARLERESYPSNMATDENGFRMLVQHIDMASEYEPWQFKQVCEKLGLDADTIHPDIAYEDPYGYLSDYMARGKFDETVVERLLARSKSNTLRADEEMSADESGKGEVAVGDDAAANDDTNDAGDGHGSGQAEADKREIEMAFDAKINSPWTLADLPMMGTWLKRNGPALDLLAAAARKPTFQIPLTRETENDHLSWNRSPTFQVRRALARGLCARAYYRIGTGDIDGAIDDVITCKRFGRHVGHGTMVVDYLVGVAIEGMADAIGILGAPAHPPTKEQLLHFTRKLDNLPPRAKLDHVMRWDRYWMLDGLQAVAHGRLSLDDLSSSSVASLSYLRGLGFDWSVVAQRLNKRYEAVIAGGVRPPSPFLGPMVFLSRAARSRKLGDILGALLTPILDALTEVARRTQCAERMHRITLAMLLYQCDHAALPPTYSVDGKGNPLHSWRVLLLPYLGQPELYKQIRLDEPWNSTHNQRFHGTDVSFYRCPSVQTARPGETTYSVVVGSEMPFTAGKTKSLTDFGPDRKIMILLVERSTPVCWMSPAIEVSQAAADAGINVWRNSNATTKSGANGIASQHPGGAFFGFRAGAVEFLSEDMDLDDFRELLRGTDARAD